MRNVKRILQLCSIALLALSICSSCLNKSSDTSLDKSYGKSDSTEIYHTIVSDDSLVTAVWHNTGEGGTAPDIDCVVKFKSEDGKLHEEHRPLLQLAHPNDDYSHHEVQKIVSLDDEIIDSNTIYILKEEQNISVLCTCCFYILDYNPKLLDFSSIGNFFIFWVSIDEDNFVSSSLVIATGLGSKISSVI